MLTKTLLYYGSATPAAKPQPLRAGPLTMWLYPDTAFLRHIRLGDHEIIRAIYGAVRDDHWSTISPRLSNLVVDLRGDSFAVSFEAECQRDNIDFFWRGNVTGDEQGTLVYTFTGEARSTFLRNRIGICVLHPIVECAGKSCRIEQVDGTIQEGTFPRYISPHQPFKDIRAIAYEAAPGARAEVRFEGETFEMEDQRNWTDASFKTYSTPLNLPMPVEVTRGTRIEQSVSLSLSGQTRKVLPVLQGRTVQFSISTTPVLQKPPIGFAVASHGQPLSGKEVSRLKLLRPAHLRVNLHLGGSEWRSNLRQAAQEAQALDTRIHAAIFLNEQPDVELESLSKELNEVRATVGLWLVFHDKGAMTSEPLLKLAREVLQRSTPGVLIAAGTPQAFVELNRTRPAPDASGFPAYSMSPQVHAFDNMTLVENLLGQVYTVETARQFAAKPVVISPISLKPSAKQGAGMDVSARIEKEMDPRQMSLFGAGWTLGSIGQLAMTGNIHSLTYFETTGALGLMASESAAAPSGFPAPTGVVYPVYHLFADLVGFDRIYPIHSSHLLQAQGLALVDGQNRKRILIANLAEEAQEIKIKTGTCQARVRYLDETNASQAMQSPEAFREEVGEVKESVSGKIELNLLPFGIARVDVL